MPTKNRTLTKFGWAPGDYEYRCRDCGGQAHGAKRGWRCLRCADAAAVVNSKEPQPKIDDATYLRLLTKFVQDAPSLDFREDRVLQWAQIVSTDAEAAFMRLATRLQNCEAVITAILNADSPIETADAYELARAVCQK